MSSIDYELLASELLRSLRGKRSQLAFSRRLKYKSNVAYLWESGRHWPRAATFFWACTRVGIDLDKALIQFHKSLPSWLSGSGLHQGAGVAQWLQNLRGDTPINVLVAQSGKNRYAVARWLKGETEPRLPDFLRMVDATSQRLLDFIGALFEPSEIPSVSGRWSHLQAARELVARIPWSPAILLVLQTEDYLALKKHEPGWIANRLGLSLEMEEECMVLLRTSGQIKAQRGCLRVSPIESVDTRQDPGAGQRLREWWAQVGLDRIRTRAEGLYSFNVFSVSNADYKKLREMHRNYYRNMRAVIAASQPEQRVVVTNVQLFALDAGKTS